ncbi:hypothetical protein [Vulgatibacter sp.]|uniref:hypothetical protein n=1 Tax=Vulgatibacter sp. TaxID=1971226 RepID=UPI00356518A7
MRRLVPLLCVLLAGCTSFNRFGAARTLAPGETSHTVAADVWAMGEGLDGPSSDELSFVPRVLPYPLISYVLRHGLAERLELGVTAMPLPGLGLDLKWNFLRAGKLDLAVVPNMLAGYLFDSANNTTVQSSLPLLLSWRIDEKLALVPQIAAAHRFDRSDGAPASESWNLAAGLAARARVSPRLTVQPGVYVLQPLDDGDRRLYSVGVALGFGPPAP